MKLVINEALCEQCNKCSEHVRSMPDAYYGQGIDLSNWTEDDAYLITRFLRAQAVCPNKAIKLITKE